jgi:membrane-associated phospholipid phosphatase
MNRIKGSGFYFINFSALLIAASLFLLMKGHANAFLSLNSFHNPVADFVFYYMTYLGDGWFAIIIAASLLLFKKTRNLGVLVLISYAVSGILAQFVKHLVEAPRPSVYFTYAQYHKFVEGVHLAGSNSFPSGHTTTAFSLASVLACFTKNKKLQFLYLILATATGYSRIYLGQHFLTDVIVGAVLGTLTTIATLIVAEKIQSRKA